MFSSDLDFIISLPISFERQKEGAAPNEAAIVLSTRQAANVFGMIDAART